MPSWLEVSQLAVNCLFLDDMGKLGRLHAEGDSLDRKVGINSMRTLASLFVLVCPRMCLAFASPG